MSAQQSLRPVIQAQLQIQCRAAEKRLEIRRDDLIKGFMAAFQMAKQQQNPGAMAAALREVGKMLGYYDARHRQEPLPVGDAGRLRRHLATLSDRQLLELAGRMRV